MEGGEGGVRSVRAGRRGLQTGSLAMNLSVLVIGKFTLTRVTFRMNFVMMVKVSLKGT